VKEKDRIEMAAVVKMRAGGGGQGRGGEREKGGESSTKSKREQDPWLFLPTPPLELRMNRSVTEKPQWAVPSGALAAGGGGQQRQGEGPFAAE